MFASIFTSVCWTQCTRSRGAHIHFAAVPSFSDQLLPTFYIPPDASPDRGSSTTTCAVCISEVQAHEFKPTLHRRTFKIQKSISGEDSAHEEVSPEGPFYGITKASAAVSFLEFSDQAHVPNNA
jgi:hypothetical protein